MRLALAVFALAACRSVPASTPESPPPDSSPAPPARAPDASRESTPQIVHAAEGRAVELRPGAPHTVRAVDVGNGAALEVLDWGGHGPPIVLLAGLGNSAHIFDDLASAFLDRWRVLGVSRRGFGGSTVTDGGYDVPSLGADILRVLDALQMPQAIFIGHSIAGEELTWLGGEHPGRVLGLVYLDAAYDRIAGRGHRAASIPEPPAMPSDLASPEGYAAYLSRGMGMPIPLDEVLSTFEFEPDGRFVGPDLDDNVIRKISEAVRVPDYARLQAPALALYALADHWTEDYAAFTESERQKFARALPSARVQPIPHAKHYLFLTHRAEVVREVRDFLTALPQPAASLRSE